METASFNSVLITGFLVGVGGFLGTIARYCSGLLISSFISLPGLATLFVNIVGSFFIGLTLGSSGKLNEQTVKIITIGALGGFTTFSAFSAETYIFIQDGKIILGITYAVIMVLLCVVATALGFMASK